jgi:Ankyrin repeats (3 copies)/Ankyrin repeat
MKSVIVLSSLLAVLPGALADDAKPRANRLPATCEVVMSPGMRITAKTPAGAITITAVDELTRSYTWEGATRAVELEPHKSRYYGSLGLFHDGAGEHWRDHHGITRCFTNEGQQHNKTVDEAMKWIKEPDRMPSVYRNDGLMVGWDKNLPGKQLVVEVWQILIDGKKPKRLPGSQDDKIVVESVETETVPLVKAVTSNDLKAVTALLAKGADANVKNSVEISVLVMAIRRGLAPMVETLLKNKADPNVRDVDTDLTPLWEALGRTDIVKLLLAAGADVNATSRKEQDRLLGLTPLMTVALGGSEELVQLFLDKGADVNAKTPIGITALSMAKSSGAEDNKGVIRRLEAAGAKE